MNKFTKQSSSEGIGIFGGTFNPIHLGHLIIAEKVRESLNSKKIIFVPSRYPPHKRTPEIGASHRYRMVKLAISANPYFIVSEIELKRKSKSYTIDTVRALKRLYPKEENFHLVLGLDAYLEINTWKDIEKLAGLIKFVVVKRPGYKDNSKLKNVKFLDLEPIGISSTEIRNRLKKGKSVRYLLPEKVRDYIYQHHLYGKKITTKTPRTQRKRSK